MVSTTYYEYKKGSKIMISIIKNSKKINKELKEYKSKYGDDKVIDDMLVGLVYYLIFVPLLIFIFFGIYVIYVDIGSKGLIGKEAITLIIGVIITIILTMVYMLHISKIQLDMYKKVYGTNLSREN